MSGSNSGARRDFGLIALIASCTALGPMANNMLLPALPDIQREFAASLSAAQTTVSFYLIAFAAGILIVGPLSDRYGRRSILLVGLAIFVAGCSIAALAPTLNWLVAGRIVQALGASAGLIVARAIAGDRYRGDQLAHALAAVTVTMMLGTSLAPVVGGYLVKWSGWHTGFWVMAALATAVIVAIWRMLPETRGAGARAVDVNSMLREAGEVLTNSRFVGHSLQIGLVYSLFLGFISVAPYVVSHVYRGDSTDYGWYYLLLSAGYFAGNLFVTTVGRSMSSENLVYAGLGLQFAGAVLGLMLAWSGYWSPLALFLPQLPLAFGQGLALPHMNSMAMSLAPQSPGVASSIIGFVQQALAGLSVQAMGLAATDTPMPISIFCAACGAVALVAMLLLTPRQAR